MMSRLVTTLMGYLVFTNLVETSTIWSVFNLVVSEENPQCVVMVVDEKKKINEQEEIIKSLGESVSLVSFGAPNISGGSLTKAGEMCPYHVMHFDTIKVAMEFLDIHKMNLRFLKIFALLQSPIHLTLQVFAEEKMEDMFSLLMRCQMKTQQGLSLGNQFKY